MLHSFLAGQLGISFRRLGLWPGALETVAICLWGLGAGCASPSRQENLAVWALGDCQLAPQGYASLLESDAFDPSTERITLSAAINEVISFQLMLSAPLQRDCRAFVQITPPRSAEGQIARERITIYRPVSLAVARSPGWLLRRWPCPARRPRYYEALAPLEGAVSIPRGESLPLWIDLEVPYGTAPGIYECQIIVTEGPQQKTELPLSLEVWPFALPAQAPPVMLAPLSVRPLLDRRPLPDASRRPDRLSQYDPDRDQMVELIHSAAALLHDHGLSVYLDDYKPVLKVDPSGQVRVLWSDYDYLARPLLDGSAYRDQRPAQHWPLPVGPDSPDPNQFEGLDSLVFAQVFSGYVSACAAHIDSLGKPPAKAEAGGPAVLVLAESAPPGPAAYQRYARLATLARQAAPDLPLITTFCPQDMSEFGWYGFAPMPDPELVDIWSPPGRYFAPQAPAKPARHRRPSWFRPDEPYYTGSLMIEAPPLDARVLAWQAYVQGASAIWLYPVNRWPQPGSVARLDHVPSTHADWLIYPGELAGIRQALPSVRLKRLRRGLQDVRYLELLRRHGRPEVARLISQTLFRAGGTEAYGDHFADSRPFGWVEDPAMWELARRLMAEQIVRGVAGQSTPSEPELAHALELEWRRLQQGCRRIRLFVQGTALHRQRQDTSAGLTAQAHLCLANETRQSLIGTLRLGEEQPVWSSALSASSAEHTPTHTSRVESVAAESRLSRRISLLLDRLPASADGHHAIPLEFDAGAAGLVRAEASLAYIVPLPLSAPIELDGDLSDWPVGMSNSASRFRLIGSRPQSPGDPAISDLPTQQTRVYLAADERYLYFAFDCREERMDELSVGMNNFVQYDGLTPVGEDFVEVVLDPTNARTRGTADLYHLLIKANGVVLSHRGLASDPPTGPHDLWFSSAEAQVRHQAEGWTVELRVPRQAFPPEARDWPIWAVNFARFQARLAEYSNWAGAKRHIYSPLSMGNLIWPEQFPGP